MERHKILQSALRRIVFEVERPPRAAAFPSLSLFCGNGREKRFIATEDLGRQLMPDLFQPTITTSNMRAVIAVVVGDLEVIPVILNGATRVDPIGCHHACHTHAMACPRTRRRKEIGTRLPQIVQCSINSFVGCTRDRPAQGAAAKCVTQHRHPARDKRGFEHRHRNLHWS